MKKNFSPGPWKLFNLPEASRIHIESATGHVVCEIMTYVRQRAPRGNAHLIQQAPEMYYILENIKAQISPEHFGDSLYKRICSVIEKVNL